MSTSLSIYRVFVSTENRERFFNTLSGIRPRQGKINGINDRSPDVYILDILVSEEELSFIKLSIPDLNEIWIQKQAYVKE